MPMTEAELLERDKNRDIGAELLESVHQMIRGETFVVPLPPVVAARAKTGLSQAAFSALLGVSVGTLQAWEHGRRNPSKAAQTLLRIANDTPEILRKYAL